MSVTIPEGAIQKNKPEEMFLAVCRDDKDRPKVAGNSNGIFFFNKLGPSWIKTINV